MTLRILRSIEQETVVFSLTGRIQAEQVPVLKDLLRTESSDVVLDLGSAKLVDRDAIQFLVECEAAGTELRNCSAYIREWIAQEKKCERKNS